MSCKICPNLDWAILSPLMELIIISESPSTIKLWKANSFANQRARRAASISTISTEAGSGICYVRAAIINLLSLQTIMPRPAMFSLAKRAPSKLTLSRPVGGGRHLMDLAIRGSFSWVGRSWLYSWRASRAMELILANGAMSSCMRNLFLHIQINDDVQENKAKRDESCCVDMAERVRPVWPATRLTRPKPDLTRPFCHVYQHWVDWD